MTDLTPEQIEELDCESRYDVFLSMVADERDLWILVNKEEEFLKIHSQDHDLEYLPLWPSAAFAEHYCQQSGQTLAAKAISAAQFFNKWVSGLEGDNLKVGVFPLHQGDVWISEPAEVKRDLQDEFSNLSI